ncbi:MAG: hypothetical protein QXN63_00330 [Candidatus Bathyarchaeia archaeon]
MLEILTTVGLFFAALPLSLVYYLKVRIERPPYGTFNWKDLLFMLFFIIITPFLYLNISVTMATIILGALFLFGLYAVLSPIIRRIAILPAAALVIAQFLWPTQGLNDIIVLIFFVGIGSLYIQGGLPKKELTAFAIAFSIYDLIATGMSSWMMEMVQKVLHTPYFPGFVFGDMLVGGGDILMGTIFVLASMKFYGKKAVALTLTSILISTTALILILPAIGITSPVPFVPVLTLCWLLTLTTFELNKKKTKKESLQ